MSTAVFAVPSVGLGSNTQTNREISMINPKMTNYQLKEHIKWMEWEEKRNKEKHEREIEALQKEVIRLNQKLLQRQEEMINGYRDSSHLRVAI